MELAFVKNDTHELIHSRGKVLSSFKDDDIDTNQIFLTLGGIVLSQSQERVDTTGYQVMHIKELPFSFIVDLMRIIEGVKFIVKALIKTHVDHPLAIDTRLSNRCTIKNYKALVEIYNSLNTDTPILPSTEYKLYDKLVKISDPKVLLTIAKSAFDHDYLLECTGFQTHLFETYKAKFLKTGNLDEEYFLADWIRDRPIKTIIGMIVAHVKMKFSFFCNACATSTNIDLSNENMNALQVIFDFYNLGEESTAAIIALAVRYGIRTDAICLIHFYEDCWYFPFFYKKNFKSVLESSFLTNENTSLSKIYIESVKRINSEYEETELTKYIKSITPGNDNVKLSIDFVCNGGTIGSVVKVYLYNKLPLVRAIIEKVEDCALGIKINNFFFIRRSILTERARAGKAFVKVVKNNSLFCEVMSFLIGYKVSAKIVKADYDTILFGLFE